MNEGDQRYIVDILRNSALIRLARPLPRQRPDATHATHPGQPIPYVDMRANGADGGPLAGWGSRRVWRSIDAVKDRREAEEHVGSR